MLSCLSCRTVPLEWRVNRVSRVVLRVSVFGLIILVLQSMNMIFISDLEFSAYVLPCVLLAPAISCLAMHMSSDKAMFFEASELLFWCALNLTFNAVILLEADSLFRHRTTIANVGTVALVPIMLGMRLHVYLAYATWTFLVNISALLLIPYVHGDGMPTHLFLFVAISFGGSVGLCLWQNHLLWAVYDSETELTFEKQAFESMTSMMCDATCWLASDKDTITVCDRKFDDAFGDEMTGKALSAYVATQEERARLAQTLEVSHERKHFAPVALLPITMKRGSGVPCRVEMYVVRYNLRDVAVTDSRPAERQFFVGIRLTQGIDFPHEQWSACTDPGDGVSNCSFAFLPEQKANDDHESAVSGATFPRTTVTGKIFKAAGTQDSVLASLAKMKSLVQQEHWYIAPDDIKLSPDQVLGQGGFGSVFQGRFYGASVAVKIPAISLTDLEALRSLANELRILRQANHPNLVTFFGAVIDTEECRMALVLELVRGASLEKFTFCDDTKEANLQRFEVITGIANALSYLHSRCPVIIHGDLKPANVVIEQRGAFCHAKLLDFGLSRLLTLDVESLGGTLRWMAPEVCNARGRNPKASSDVFSFGYLVYFVTTGNRPFAGCTDHDVREHHRSGRPANLSWLFWSAFDHASKSLSKACLKPVECRPCIKAITKMLCQWWDQGVFEEITGAVHWKKHMLGADCSWLESLKTLGPRDTCPTPVEASRNAKVPSVLKL
eukprot:TRINITY_DN32156_c0_g1_i1.p1 TRINITY_DN32156_c0_g1~~TRINITY_DN32156_c0_g1_i1.p1  ORF type:complete len:727 (-),score=74.54 TRINITY_DN32156_c0_g1_i1:308-2488(-)